MRLRWIATAVAGVALLLTAGVVAAGRDAKAATVPGDLSNGDYYVVAGDQATGQLMAFDPADTNWNDTPVWSWKPASPAYSSTEIAAFKLVSDFKRRVLPDGSQRFVATASNGLMTELTYPGRQRIWAATVPSSANPHAIELLPDGNVAVAASTGGWVRVYAASQGGSTSYAEFKLSDAHAALWDPTIQRLWTIGHLDDTAQTPVLTALEIYGTPAAPKLREDTARRVRLPTGGGHDVYADPGDGTRLLVSTGSQAYVYDKVSRTFDSAALGAAARVGVKSIGRQPSGQLVETRPDSVRSPVGPCSSVDSWCTDTVDFFNAAIHALSFSRSRSGAQFYKARVWNPYYATVDTPLRGKVWDRTRGADGSWTAAVTADGNASIAGATAAVSADGTLHLFTVLPGGGIWEHTYGAAGWSTAQQIDTNGSVTQVAAAPAGDGTLHLFAVVPGSGVWERVLTGATWGASATKRDANTAVSRVAAALGTDGVLHLYTVVPGSGVWERTLAGGVWGASAQQRDANGAVTEVSATGRADGTLHLYTIVPGSGVWERTLAGGAWGGAVRAVAVTASGDITALAAAAVGSLLHLSVVRSGYGVDEYVRAADTWSLADSFVDNATVLGTYLAALPDGTVHLGTVPELS